MRLIDKETFSVERPGATTHSGGVSSKAASTSFTIKGNAQPLSGKELLQLPEGDRQRQNKKLFTRTEIRNDDLITIGGVPFEVQTVEDWTRQIRLPHYEARIMKVDI